MRNIIAMFVVAASCLIAANAAFSADCPSTDQTPDSSTWIQGDRRSYEEPGAGFSVAFRGRYGFGTVYVFDASETSWIEGRSDPRLIREIENVVVGVKELERRARYTEVSFGPVVERNFHCLDSLFLVINGKLDFRQITSATALSVRNGKVLKVRATFYSDPPLGVEAEVSSLLRTAIEGGSLK